MFKVIYGNLFNSKADCIAVPVKRDLVLEGNLGGQAAMKLGPRALFDISLLKNINYGEATLIYTHGALPSKAVVLVANTWKSRIKDHKEAQLKTEKYLVKSFISCFETALEGGFKSIAIPPLSTGMYGLTFPTCFNCLIKAYEGYKDKIDLDFHISKPDTYKNNKDLIGDYCDEYIAKDDFDPINKLLIESNRGHYHENWFKKNEYGEVHGKGKKFTQALANAIQISGKQHSIIYADVMGKTQFSEYLNGKVAPKKEKVIALCLNMELDEEQINEVLGSFSLKLNPNDDFDKVILKCILDKEYISDEVNKRLKLAGQKEIFKIVK